MAYLANSTTGKLRLKASKSEAVAVDMLEELFRNRNFEKHLIDIVVKSLLRDKESKGMESRKLKKKTASTSSRLS